MASISLAPYTLRFRLRGNKTYLPLGELSGNDDAVDHLSRFLAGLEISVHDEETRSLFRLTRFEAGDRRFEGILETGEYGYTTQLVDVAVDKDAVSHRRRASEAELLPFYFLFEVPRRADQGYVLLQRFGSFGIRVALAKALKEHFDRTPYMVELHPLVPEKVVRMWGGAKEVRRLRLVQFKVPENIAQAFGLGDREEIYSELVIRARKGSTFPLPRRFSGPSGDGMAELQDLQAQVEGVRKELRGIFEPDLVKLEVEVDGRIRTLNVTDPGDLVAYHDVTEEVGPLDANGHPEWEKIRSAALDLLRDLYRTVQSLQGQGASPGSGSRRRGRIAARGGAAEAVAPPEPAESEREAG